jgi:predicted transcriptional regulator
VPILKAPPRQPKNATLQLRIDEDLKTKLEKYAEFLDTTGAYVVSEALRLVFSKDAEFKEWLERQDPNGKKSDAGHIPATTEKTNQPPVTAVVAQGTNGNRGLFR